MCFLSQESSRSTLPGFKIRSSQLNSTQMGSKKDVWILKWGSEYLSVPSALRKMAGMYSTYPHTHYENSPTVRVASDLPCLSALVLANTMLA